MGSRLRWSPDPAEFVMRRLDEAEAATLQAIAAGASLDAGEGGELIALAPDSTMIFDEAEQFALAPLVCSCDDEGWHATERDPSKVLVRIYDRREIARDCIARRESPNPFLRDEPFLHVLASGWRDHSDWYAGWGPDGEDFGRTRRSAPRPTDTEHEPPAIDD
ncbi:DUF6221 family protein [Phytoactinopolyspora halotolerans]|uniref:Uncharacterized protein n=1 Tax=Phytoactinopolyspora halotolerans TaxID=1981512 RepID=A0A6L9S3Z4_9ACTN|nr:DUF6221 family protein [Phytoactinopolyspora halotolerans]NED99311.1 hypothetical protein [Phytoactinopolyspora halotolerans]